MLLVAAGDEGKSLGGLDLPAVLAELPPGRLAHHQHADGHDGGGNEADTHGDAPRGGGLDALRTVVDTIGDEDAEGDEQLVGGDEGTTDLAGRGLGLVHGRQDGQGTDAEAVDETADDDLVPRAGGADADDVADDVDETPEGDAVLSAELVRDGAGDEGADQAADAEHADQQTLSYVAERHDAVGIDITEAAPEVIHLSVPADGTTFPPEDEATERHEQAHDEDAYVEDLGRRVVAVVAGAGGFFIVPIGRRGHATAGLLC